MRAVAELGLPAGCVARRWQGWRLVGPDGRERVWANREPLGAVLDFAALRSWLVQEVRSWGGSVHFGCCAVRVERNAVDGIVTVLRNNHDENCLWHLRSRYVVDASGQARALIGQDLSPDPRGDRGARDPLIRGSGVEWLLQVDPHVWQRWAQELSFFLGSRWVPHGYGWIFPMAPGVLKLGVCRFERAAGMQLASGITPIPYTRLLQRLLAHTELRDAVVLDRHGGRIRSRVRRSDPHRKGRLLAVGDAVSTANLLGGEGIRHAMYSGRLLGDLLNRCLRSNSAEALTHYDAQLRKALGWRWSLSGRLATKTWFGLSKPTSDRRLIGLLDSLERKASAETLAELLFDYRFERYGLRALRYAAGWRTDP